MRSLSTALTLSAKAAHAELLHRRVTSTRSLNSLPLSSFRGALTHSPATPACWPRPLSRFARQHRSKAQLMRLPVFIGAVQFLPTSSVMFENAPAFVVELLRFTAFDANGNATVHR